MCERKIACGQKKMEGEEQAFGEFTCYGSGGDCFLHQDDGPRALRRDSEVRGRDKKVSQFIHKLLKKTCLAFTVVS